MLRRVWDGIADGFKGAERKQRSMSYRVAASCAGMLRELLHPAAVLLLIVAGYYLFKIPGVAARFNEMFAGFNDEFHRLTIAMVVIAVIWAIVLFIKEVVDRTRRKGKKDPDPQESIGMAARLGDVLYWASTLVACLMAVLIAYAVLFGTGQGDLMVQGLVLFVAAIIWLIGRAARYVLAGR